MERYQKSSPKRTGRHRKKQPGEWSRILLFYVGTMAVLMALWPWNQVGMEASPFVQIFSYVGVPAAAHILNFVVLTAAVSVYNSAIYSNSRMLYGLATKEEAPEFLGRLSGRGVAVRGIFVSSGITLICVALNYFFPGTTLEKMNHKTTE